MMGLLVSFLATVVAGSVPAHEAAASCVPGEFREMGPPMVTVLSGPGNAQDEEARWTELMTADGGFTRAHLGGHGEIILGETSYDFEEVQ